MNEPALGPSRRAAHYPGCLAATPARVDARTLRAACVLAAAFGLMGCAHRPANPLPRTAAASSHRWATVAPANPDAANAVLMRAISLVGTPYRFGGNTPEGGFDCSGLVNYVYRDMLDLRLPRSSRDLAGWQGPRIAQEGLAPADLVFFGSAGDVSHVGIYVGEGRFVHAPRTGGTVRLDRLDGPYWREHYSGATRVLH